MIRPLLWLPLAALSLAVVPTLAQDGSLEKTAKKLHALAGGEYCEARDVDDEDSYASWTFRYTPNWGFNPADEEEVTLIRIWCMAGAYNVTHAYYLHREYEGLMPIAFAVPAYETVYEEGDAVDAALKSLTVVGMNASMILTNSEFDPETLTISSTAFWRGIGDASSSGTWVFAEGEFTLAHYEIDASYDGEINPETVVDYK